MNKLFLASLLLAIFLGFVAFYYKNVAIEQERLKDVYCANNQVLIDRVRKIYDDKVATDRTNEELRRAIAEDKNSNFDWTTDISATLPIITLKQLHTNRNTIR